MTFLKLLNLFISFWKWLLHCLGVLEFKNIERVLKIFKFLNELSFLLAFCFAAENIRMVIHKSNILNVLFLIPFSFNRKNVRPLNSRLWKDLTLRLKFYLIFARLENLRLFWFLNIVLILHCIKYDIKHVRI
jgi:hypothetical protein